MNQPNVGSTKQSEISVVTAVPMLEFKEREEQKIQIAEERSKEINSNLFGEFIFMGGVKNSSLDELIEEGVFCKEDKAELIKNKNKRPNVKAKIKEEEQR